jgi:hypothetical protein
VLVAVTFSQGLCSNTVELCETHSEIIEAKLNEILFECSRAVVREPRTKAYAKPRRRRRSVPTDARD